MFKRNVGKADRAIRVVLGIAVLAAGVYYQSWLGLIGVVPLLTAFLGSCPLYTILGVSTCPLERATTPGADQHS